MAKSISEKIARGRASDASKSDVWFAWRPVQVGALGHGGWVWMRRVWRNRCCGVVIYQMVDG